MELPENWKGRVEKLTYAYQPIVNIHTGRTFGLEALLRNWEDAEFDSIAELFQKAYEEKVLFSLEKELRKKALSGFSRIRKKWNTEASGSGKIRLFLNIDNRAMEMPDYMSGGTEVMLEHYQLTSQDLVLEISEKHEFSSFGTMNKVLDSYKNRGFGIAIDDFGSGYSGLQLLYHSEPHIIKIDRFFIDNIDSDPKKYFFIASVVKMANLMGISVIAEGIETESEYYACRNIGCDYIQGFFICHPKLTLDELKSRYPDISDLAAREKREHLSDVALLDERILKETPVKLDVSAHSILDLLKKGGVDNHFPVIDERGEPLGILDQDKLRQFLYSPYGISIFQHKMSTEGLSSFLLPVPRTEITTPIERILGIQSLRREKIGIIITQEKDYLGFLPSGILLQLLSEKQLSLALDKNPLSHLPGNSSIHRFIGEILETTTNPRALVYFDFNNFKPFNDCYGFRQGDRVIMLFADLLKEALIPRKDFVGHLGGDDFFCSAQVQKGQGEPFLETVRDLQNCFAEDVLSFYTAQDRLRGCILSRDRQGNEGCFPLLTVSAAVLFLDGKKQPYFEGLSEQLAMLKKKAKTSAGYLAWEEGGTSE